MAFKRRAGSSPASSTQEDKSSFSDGLFLFLSSQLIDFKPNININSFLDRGSIQERPNLLSITEFYLFPYQIKPDQTRYFNIDSHTLLTLLLIVSYIYTFYDYICRINVQEVKSIKTTIIP